MKRFACPAKVQAIGPNLLSNVVEHDHRYINRCLRQMCGFKSFGSASATFDGIKVVNMIPKKQFARPTTSGFRLSAGFAGYMYLTTGFF
ncbi:DDE-type integrase/transposase/recombinase [Ruegeria atlantica]|uniref:DDE-type integrase/transposase/recombinase n=1 Tax=Ruegeria atlantica TaxID=81569 RepID=UPI00147C6B13